MLLAVDGVIAARFGEHEAHGGFGRAVDCRDFRPIGLALDGERRLAEPGQRDCIGTIGRRERHDQFVGQIHDSVGAIASVKRL